MNPDGKAQADQALTKIDPGTTRHHAPAHTWHTVPIGILSSPSLLTVPTDDTTNTWDALNTAWAVARGPALADYDNVNILLLTDGEPSPNTIPPGGIENALRDLMAEQPSHATISAFGFGYQMNSELLLQIATTGHGAFAYIKSLSCCEKL
jgi:hypothetical protein